MFFFFCFRERTFFLSKLDGIVDWVIDGIVDRVMDGIVDRVMPMDRVMDSVISILIFFLLNGAWGEPRCVITRPLHYYILDPTRYHMRRFVKSTSSKMISRYVNRSGLNLVRPFIHLGRALNA